MKKQRAVPLNYRLWLSLNQPKFTSELELHCVGRFSQQAPHTRCSHSSPTAAGAEAAAQPSHFGANAALRSRKRFITLTKQNKANTNYLCVMSYYWCGRCGRDFSPP